MSPVEPLLNWAVLLSTLAILGWVAWAGVRDLRFPRERPAPPMAEPRAYPDGVMRSQAEAQSGREAVREEAPDGSASDGSRRLRVTYRKDGLEARTQWILEGQPGYIGTEALPNMGPGILVRHARLTDEGNGFRIENRHSERPIPWVSDDGERGELPPRESMPVGHGMEIQLGSWVVAIHPFDEPGSG